MSDELEQFCENCNASGAHPYHLFGFHCPEEANGDLPTERKFLLCVGCARLRRQRIKAEPWPDGWLTRYELIAELDRFFASSGVFDICARCHRQGTGCCPPTCRIISQHGCNQASKYGKTVFCAAFVCGALLNAISECDAETGRALKWVKNALGAPEFRVYEMITRVPSSARDPVRPLALPKRYPLPAGLGDGEKIKKKLAALADEVLEVRRRWHEQELLERAQAPATENTGKTDSGGEN